LTKYFVTDTVNTEAGGMTSTPGRKEMLPIATLNSADAAAAVLDETRVAILATLREPGSAASVAAKLAAPRQRIGYHVRALERAGLVVPVREKAHGGLVERLVQASAGGYVVAPQALGPLAPDATTISDRFSTGYQLAVASRIIHDLTDLRARAERGRKTVPTLTIDTRVRVASAEAQQAFATDLANAVARVIEKHNDDRTPGGRTFACAVTVHPNVNPSDAGSAQ
jgi:DNA-binding transcriptional ArsR family regulator